MNIVKEAAFTLLFLLGMGALVYAWVQKGRQVWQWFQNLDWDGDHRSPDRIRDAGRAERTRIERKWP